MDWEHREIFQEEEDSDNEFNQSENLDEDEKQEYCFGSVPMSKLQPRKVLSSARWVSEMRIADVEVQKGPIWRTTGIARRGKIYCSVEEVLFLVELGVLILMDDSGAITSVEEVYTKLSDEKNGCCWDYFQAYRQLKSLGYIVGRHGIPWSLKSVIGNIEYSVPQCLVKNAADSKAEAESKAEVCLSVMLSRMQIDEAKPVFDVYLPNSKFRKSCPGDPSFVICFTRGYPPSKETVEVLDRQCRGVPLKFCHVEQGKVSFFSFDKVDLPVLP